MCPNSVSKSISERPQLRFWKITIFIVVDDALWTVWVVKKNTIFLFVHVALRAASILLVHIFLYLQSVLCSRMDLSIGSILKLLVLKNAVECIRQLRKWMSGARVVIIFRFDLRTHGRTSGRNDFHALLTFQGENKSFRQVFKNSNPAGASWPTRTWPEHQFSV